VAGSADEKILTFLCKIIVISLQQAARLRSIVTNLQSGSNPPEQVIPEASYDWGDAIGYRRVTPSPKRGSPGCSPHEP
jgi:hypothetical protein